MKTAEVDVSKLREPEQRQIVIDHISHLASLGFRSNAANSSEHFIGFLEAMADGSSDTAVAFQKNRTPLKHNSV